MMLEARAEPPPAMATVTILVDVEGKGGCMVVVCGPYGLRCVFGCLGWRKTMRTYIDRGSTG